MHFDLSENAGRLANSVDPDQTLRSAASDQGLHCSLNSVCPNTKYGRFSPFFSFRNLLKYIYNIIQPLGI